MFIIKYLNKDKRKRLKKYGYIKEENKNYYIKIERKNK